MSDKNWELMFTKLDALDQRMSSLDQRMSSSDQKISSMDQRMSRMEALQESQGEHMKQLIQIVGSTNARLEELTEEVQQVKDDVSIVKEETNILKMNQQTILNLQYEQQKILERLSIRSISHEADIAEIRRIK